MVKDEELKELAHSEYWDQRYALAKRETEDGSTTITSFEWFRTFENLRPFFERHLPAASSGCYILHLGCGNSVSLASLFRNGCFFAGSPPFRPFFYPRQTPCATGLSANLTCLDPDVDSRFVCPGLHQPDQC